MISFRERRGKMLRIGETAKLFDISNRTLRHWEEKGILKSFRTDSGYRLYDDENIIRIKQIALLRKLEIPIGDIEKMFTFNDVDISVEIMKNNLMKLRRKKDLFDGLSYIIERLILNLQKERSLDQWFLYLENQTINHLSKENAALQILLSERNMDMSNINDVRIVRIPEMTVASYCAESEMPEMDCSKEVDKFVLENSLHKKGGFRHFGFNNPSPTENNPVYGYEIWIAVPEGFEIPEPFIRKNFEGGLYASISSKVKEIGEKWALLYNWVMESEKYAFEAEAQWLEECVDYETFISEEEGERKLDLLCPIKLI
ncbi:MAG: MerR family transcriptional regulator [Lachnospiraceae bacterium]|jgi:DNA-binding transcriptional MerR regulator/predicted transcriptional regulator YdeE|nr:MerR family transcriptional regulator [Lachnospiraceae bacterium]